MGVSDYVALDKIQKCVDLTELMVQMSHADGLDCE